MFSDTSIRKRNVLAVDMSVHGSQMSTHRPGTKRLSEPVRERGISEGAGGRWQLLANCDVIMLVEPTRRVDVVLKYEIYRIMQDLV